MVKFTINVKTQVASFVQARGNEFSVTRSYHDFVWLHTSLTENELYQGLLIPPKPYRPEFEQTARQTDSNLTPEEKEHAKTELESEYLALFKKTVAMHEAFLVRIVNHDKLRFGKIHFFYDMFYLKKIIFRRF